MVSSWKGGASAFLIGAAMTASSAAGVHPAAVGETGGADERVVPPLRDEDGGSAVADERREVLRARRRLALLGVQDHRL